MKRVLPAICLLMMLVVQSASAASVPAKDKGLLISPLRAYVSLDAGSSQTGSLSVADLNDVPLSVTLSAKQFSVADYSYNYQFNEPPNDWLKLSTSHVTLQPDQSQQVKYTISVPSGAAPGGQYYTLFASTTVSSSAGIKSTVQAATLLYVTVNGQLDKSSRLQASSIQHLSFGKQLNFQLTPVDTGNIYYFIYVSGELNGLFTKPDDSPVTHILMPGAPRHVSDSIETPVLPGVYQATYGYKTDSGATVMRSAYVVFIPPWFIALLLAVLLIAGRFTRGKHRKREKVSKPDK